MADANFALLDKRGKKYVIVAGRKFSSIGVIWTLEQKGIFSELTKNGQKSRSARPIIRSGRDGDQGILYGGPSGPWIPERVNGV